MQPHDTQNEEEIGALFKPLLLQRDFEEAKEVLKKVDEEGFVVEEMEEVINSFRGENLKSLLQSFFDVFVEGGQEDFFWYIEMSKLESIADIYPLFPEGMKGC